jgi:hypothetical protein
MVRVFNGVGVVGDRRLLCGSSHLQREHAEPIIAGVARLELFQIHLWVGIAVKESIVFDPVYNHWIQICLSSIVRRRGPILPTFPISPQCPRKLSLIKLYRVR